MSLGDGEWVRCQHCDNLTYRDSGRCPDPECPGNKPEGDTDE